MGSRSHDLVVGWSCLSAQCSCHVNSSQTPQISGTGGTVRWPIPALPLEESSHWAALWGLWTWHVGVFPSAASVDLEVHSNVDLEVHGSVNLLLTASRESYGRKRGCKAFLQSGD